MRKPNKIYTLTIVYNEELEELQYLQETISLDDADILDEPTMLLDFSDYWDEESLELLTDNYYLAEA